MKRPSPAQYSRQPKTNFLSMIFFSRWVMSLREEARRAQAALLGNATNKNHESNHYMIPRTILQRLMLPPTTLARARRGLALLRIRTRRRFGLARLGALVATLLTQSLFAQGWYTVQYYPGTNSSSAYALAKDPTGTIIYSAGYGQDASGALHALAFKSTNGGTNWALMDDYQNTGDPYYTGIAADSAGNIYAAGPYDIGGTWFTRGSTDGGATWSTVDALSFGGEVAHPHAVATDGAGNVYVAGDVGTNGFGFQGFMWGVRKGTGGSSWTTVDLVGTETNKYFWNARGVLCHPTGAVFVVGRTPGPTTTSQQGQTIYSDVWTVRRDRKSVV